MIVLSPGRGSVVGRTALEGQPVQVADVLADPENTLLDVQKIGNYRAGLSVPLLREGIPIGVLCVTRSEPRSFTDKQIELLTTFADQAVIAIENVRLFKAEQQRTRELSESLEQQTATSEVLKVISRSAFDLQPVFDAMAENAVKLCQAEKALIFRFDGELLRSIATYNVGPENREFVDRNPIALGQHSISARAALERRTVQVADVQADPNYAYAMREDTRPIRTVLAVPMLKDEELVGTITIYRSIHRQTDRAAGDLRRAGRHRHREHAAAQRIARVVAAADCDGRRTQSHQSINFRFAGGAGYVGAIGSSTVPRRSVGNSPGEGGPLL
jgi:GAF domain-containing protein